MRDASDEKHRDITCYEEEDEGHAFQSNRRRKHGTPADMIRESAEHEQRADEADDVDREDERERRVRKTPLLLVNDIQRRRCARRRGEDDEDRRDRREGIRERKAAGLERSLGGIHVDHRHGFLLLSTCGGSPSFQSTERSV